VARNTDYRGRPPVRIRGRGWHKVRSKTDVIPDRYVARHTYHLTKPRESGFHDIRTRLRHACHSGTGKSAGTRPWNRHAPKSGMPPRGRKMFIYIRIHL
jgi:hypothetical protein